jgi:hypothetical protein
LSRKQERELRGRKKREEGERQRDRREKGLKGDPV